VNALYDTLAGVSFDAGLRPPLQPNAILEVIREGLEHVAYAGYYCHVEAIYLEPGEPEPEYYPPPRFPNWRGRVLAFAVGLVVGLVIGWLPSRF